MFMQQHLKYSGRSRIYGGYFGGGRRFPPPVFSPLRFTKPSTNSELSHIEDRSRCGDVREIEVEDWLYRLLEERAGARGLKVSEYVALLVLRARRGTGSRSRRSS